MHVGLFYFYVDFWHQTFYHTHFYDIWLDYI